MPQLTTAIKADSEELPILGQSSYVFISSCNLRDV